MGARVEPREEGRAEDRGEEAREGERREPEDREPLAERARDVRGEADVRDAMAGRLPGRSP